MHHRGLIIKKEDWEPVFNQAQPIFSTNERGNVEPETVLSDDDYLQLTIGLIERGFSEKEILKILGENLLRVYKNVWRYVPSESF